MISNLLYVIIGALIGFFIGALILYSAMQKQANDFEKKSRENFREYNHLYREYDNLVNQYNRLVNQYNAVRNKNNTKINATDDLKEAVKFAMIQAHPDKGVCKDSDTFIKFRKLYKKIA